MQLSLTVILYCKLIIKVNLEDNQLCANYQILCDISVDFQAVHQNNYLLIVKNGHILSLRVAFED